MSVSHGQCVRLENPVINNGYIQADDKYVIITVIKLLNYTFSISIQHSLSVDIIVRLEMNVVKDSRVKCLAQTPNVEPVDRVVGTASLNMNFIHWSLVTSLVHFW